jgi:hypothetical protein
VRRRPAPPRFTPPAAKVLASLLDKLRSASAPGLRGGLALVRTMTEKDGALDVCRFYGRGLATFSARGLTLLGAQRSGAYLVAA